ncbi:serine hydrolase domain-containing protein [Mangrovimonas spongiae]|uniref:Class A beta-lactamase-related serine hydrolase n=1 Tax=Mangrovimonas spongiae TaxID=2494697 RepID=A0A428K1Y8_9FLAO|nr:serine hydrolase domain-containing protein [Mangrovimonas spongiae]RSK40415.1 class A beta-lactamase-related serine hydrolase [Mangrovimonas spongiae]
MKNTKFSLLAIIVVVLSSCLSNKKDNKNHTTAREINFQQRVENNIYKINKNGEDDSTATTIESRMKALNVAGVSISVFNNNKILWSKGYGKKNKETGEDVNKHTLFQAASISKPIASVAAFKLIEENKLSLNENVNSKLIRWQIPDNEFTKTEKVTLRRIMSHTSGLGTSGFQGYNKKDSIPTLLEILQGSEITNSEPVRVVQKPGESELYSGGGMQVLQMLIEDVTKKEFPKFLNTIILKPTKMNNSSFVYPLSKKLERLTANGYNKNSNVIDGGYHIYPEKAAAGLWTTPTDLALFMIALGKSYRGEDNNLLSQESAKTMMTRVPNAGGIGIGLDGKGEAFRFRHTGGNAGFVCYAVSFADTGRGAVVMTNSDNGFPLIHEIIRAISRAYNWPAMWMHE